MEPVLKKRRRLLSYSKHSSHYETDPHSARYSTEAARIESFEGWPIPEIQNPLELAKAGFYYLGFKDAVECFHCGSGHNGLIQGIDLFYEHVKHYPGCTFIRDTMCEDYFSDLKRRIREEKMVCSADELLLSYKNKWPGDARKTAEELAEAGFFYTGPKDQVQCHQCHVVKKNWRVYDDPWFQHAKLSPKCKFVSNCKGPEFLVKASLVALCVKKEHKDRLQLLNNKQRINESPYDKKYSFEEKRMTSFRSLEITYIQKEKLAQVGFYYTGTEDDLKCFYCGIEFSFTWLRAKDAAEEHARFSPACLFIRQKKGDLFVEVEQKKLRDIFKSEKARMESFKEWPTWSFKIPTELAKAGFFCTGNDDQTQCFECGVHFRNWKIYDDPWFIHSSLSPTCKFILEAKGRKFVDLVKLALVSKKNKNTTASSDESSMNTEDEVCGELRNLMNSITVQTALNHLGFDEILIRDTLQNRLNKGESFENPEKIFQAVLESQRQDPDLFALLQDLEKDNKRIQEMKICKICGSQGPMFIFIPCGHLHTCCDCAKNLKKCMGCEVEPQFKLELFPNNTISS